MSLPPVKLGFDVTEAEEKISKVDKKIEKTDEDVDELVQRSKERSDLAYLKVLETVDRAEAVFSRAISIFGKGLSQTKRATIDFATQAISTLIPIFTAQSMSGWQTAQAALGLIALGQAGAELKILLSDDTESTLPNSMQYLNNEVGRLNW